MARAQIICGDARDVLRTLPDASVRCVVTSPPYWGAQRDYGMMAQLGMEKTPELFCAELVSIFREVRRALAADGVVWLNLGDSYAASGKGGGGRLMKKRGDAWGHRDRMRGWRKPPPGYKPKDLCGVPWMAAFALRADGWFLRRDVVWAKSVATEPTRSDRPSAQHEFVFLLSKAKHYAFNRTEIPQGDVWRIPSGGVTGHTAAFPEELARRCILAGSSEGDLVMDPFAGSGRAGIVALKHGRDFIGIELNPRYAQMARDLIRDDAPLLNTEVA